MPPASASPWHSSASTARSAYLPPFRRRAAFRWRYRNHGPPLRCDGPALNLLAVAAIHSFSKLATSVPINGPNCGSRSADPASRCPAGEAEGSTGHGTLMLVRVCLRVGRGAERHGCSIGRQPGRFGRAVSPPCAGGRAGGRSGRGRWLFLVEQDRRTVFVPDEVPRDELDEVGRRGIVLLDELRCEVHVE
jgi:hypothetical protein